MSSADASFSLAMRDELGSDWLIWKSNVAFESA